MKEIRLNGNGVKLVAAITMLIDHIGAALLETSANLEQWKQIDLVLRGIGRIAFPLYCFLLVEGFLHTRDVKKYWLRLLAFCLISEIPFDLAIFQTVCNWQHQNVFFTLLLGLTALEGVKRLEDEFMAHGDPTDLGQRLIWGAKTTAVIMVCGGIAWLLRTDYDIIGVCWIVLFYFCRMNPQMQLLLAVLTFFWEPTAVFAWLPMYLYDGTRGSAKWKYWFYGFYPVHLLVLWGIRMIL